MAGQHCSKKLWQSHHDPLPYMPSEPGTATYMGSIVGEKAHALFPGGVLVDDPPWEHDEAARKTRALMETTDAPAIFEAAFDHDGVRVRVDILERFPDGAWGLSEVKSSTGPKDEYYEDIALQCHVVVGCGVSISSAELIHVNNTYIRGEAGIDWHGFFRRLDVGGDIEPLLGVIPDVIKTHYETLDKLSPPDIEPSLHCSKLWGCDFWNRCTSHKPEDWVLHLPRVGSLFETLSSQGIEAVSDIPETFPLTNQHAIIREVLVSGKEYVSPDLWKALENLGPPAFYLDFEAMQPAIPLYPGTRPYQRIPFQWSLHYLDDLGKLSHQSFLADGATDPRREMSEKLISALGQGEEPVLVYSSYEKGVISDLAALFPDLESPLNGILKRLKDLLPVVRSHSYHPDYQFSFSIKTVAPALAPHLDYGQLETVAEGMAAAAAFERVVTGDFLEGENAEILRQALLQYCHHDTLAMVEVHQALRERANSQER